MTDQHRATPEQWDYVDVWGVVHDCAPSSCILELRARIEALEAAQQDKLDRLIALDAADPTPDPAMAELRAVSAEAQPAGGLVERVANAISEGDEPDKWHPEARDAIREVAKWLRDRYPKSPEAGAVAFNLCEEADRG
jgi:hypothetical protein